MLGKLLKYDLKWIYKVIVVFYILAIVFALLGRGLTEIENSVIFNIIGKICLGTSIGMMVSIIINNVMRIWSRFINNMYKDESYLTHTLPVKKSTIYLSKALTSVITMITSSIVILVALMIAYYSKENLEAIKNTLNSMAEVCDTSLIGFLTTTYIILFLEFIFAVFAGILGIIVGHKLNNNKIVVSLITGFAFYMIPGSITVMAIFVLGIFNPDVMNLFKTTNELSIETIKTILNMGIVLYIVYIFTYYFIGNKLLKKGINVE